MPKTPETPVVPNINDLNNTLQLPKPSMDETKIEGSKSGIVYSHARIWDRQLGRMIKVQIIPPNKIGEGIRDT